ncbi:hypothetical protein H6B10_17725, partial [Gemmiger formicilis]|nr:hypothetical protein [Gemmiger formicilis]
AEGQIGTDGHAIQNHGMDAQGRSPVGGLHLTVSQLRLAEGEYRFACLVWDHEPLPSGELVKLAADALGWKK